MINNRAKFVGIMSVSALIYGAILAYRLIGFQADGVSDVIKFSILILPVTALVTCVWWTLIMRKFSGPIAGGFAGFLSAICIIPIPTLAGAFKSKFTENHDFVAALSGAIEYSLSTFSTAEALAIPLSVIVGIWAGQHKA